MGVRLPTAAEIENLRRVLEEEAHRSLKREHTQLHIESVEAEICVFGVVEDDVVSMPAPLNKADAYSKPALNGKSKKR